MQAVVDAARPPAIAVLLDSFNEVRAQVESGFATLRNPLDNARDAIIDSHEHSLRKSDAQRRKRVLADALTLLSEERGGK